jgi:hypothetical protein
MTYDITVFPRAMRRKTIITDISALSKIVLYETHRGES